MVQVGMAFASISEIRLRMGDLTGAAAAFAKAEELDASALPGRAGWSCCADAPPMRRH